MGYLSIDTLVNLVVGLIGAGIGGYFTLKGTKQAHRLALEKEAAADHEKMITTLMLLRTEIATAWQIFRSEIGDEVLAQAPDEPLLRVFPIGESPFSLYNSAPQALNLLPSDLAQDLVHFYMRAKGLVAMIEMNNRDYEQALQHGRNLLGSRLVQDRNMSEQLQQELFQSGVEYMASMLGMGDSAEAIRGLARELAPVVKRITTAVDDLLVPQINRIG
ncbi:hypothetical protein [Pseudomonas hunanensis]|uniref:Uncharacterized protein n=1 Tax=Pseudomonas hunanensis TaxID=1247546 RepID=A0ACC9MXQ0_9PSED|nr:hypothetical protein [Pseudomonas hunanensis]PKF23679.1 hypothetical protein CW309_26040 [Pseudomonas hunanensis]